RAHRQELRPDLLFDLASDLAVLQQEGPGVVLALTDPAALVRVPGAGLLDDSLGAAQVDDLALPGDAGPVHDLELRLAERRGHLVLDDLHARHVAGHFLAILDGADAADVQAHGGIELQRVAASGGLGIAEHHPDLHADLVDEDDDRVVALDVAGELAQRLGHQPGVQAHLHITHLALDLRLGREGRDRVDHYDVHGARAHEHIGDLQRLLARIRLGYEQVVDVHA